MGVARLSFFLRPKVFFFFFSLVIHGFHGVCVKHQAGDGGGGNLCVCVTYSPHQGVWHIDSASAKAAKGNSANILALYLFVFLVPPRAYADGFSPIVIL